MFIAMLAILFGSFTASAAFAFAPDVAKAKTAAAKICTILQTPSKMDPIENKKGSKQINEETFRGQIEFRDVWFRYPSAPLQWVLKGLNLTINQNENVAIIGESGSGKSTFINLVMRFYDPEFGEVLIDGVNVKDYNVNDLRQRMGLVRANSPGVLSAVLSAEAKKINGVSAEPFAAISEALFSIGGGLAFGFVFCWPITLCALGLLPILWVANKIKHKFIQMRYMNVVSDSE